MARLDAMLGRSLLDAPDDGVGEAPAPTLWLDDELRASRDAPRTRHKGSSAEIQRNKRPDPSVDRAESDRIWYRMPDSWRSVSYVSAADSRAA